MAVRLLKGSWWVDFQWKMRRCRRRSPVNTKGGAQQYEAWLRNQLLMKGSLDHLDAESEEVTKVHVPTLAEFSVRWLREYVDANNGLSEQKNKRTSLRVHLIPFFGALRLDEISVNMVEKFKAELRAKSYSAKSININLTVLNRCLGTAREWEIINAVPRIRLLKMVPPPFRFLSPSEVDALLGAIPEATLRAMARTAARAGLRYSELRALRWTDVNFAQEQLSVRSAFVQNQMGPTKNHRVRHVPLTDDLSAELHALPRTSEFVFAVGRAHPRLLEALKDACDRAGVPCIGWHDLRHTFASHMMVAGAPIHAVKELLGHSTIEMTMRYAHLAPTVLRSAISLLRQPNDFWDEKSQPGVNRCSEQPQVGLAPA